VISFMDIPGSGRYGKFSFRKTKSGNYLIYYRGSPFYNMNKFEFRDKVYRGAFFGIGEFGEQSIWEDLFFNIKKYIFNKQIEDICK
jgi:hypothetical protein